MPKSTLHNILKKENIIEQKTSRLKVQLNEEQMFQRICYCLSMTRWRALALASSMAVSVVLLLSWFSMIC